MIRFVLPSQLDDVNPLMDCSEEELNLADVYFVVPKFENVSISNFDSQLDSKHQTGQGTWCEEISKKGKEIGLHGVYHGYHEFGEFRDIDYLDEGIEIFEECFGKNPETFKPPQIYWTSDNDWIRDRMGVKLFWNQVTHKVYHCGDSGLFPNWMVRIF